MESIYLFSIKVFLIIFIFYCLIIRFSEIASKLETSFSYLPQIKESFEIREEKENYILYSTNILWECLEKCWSKDYFLDLLFHKFFKLSLQIIFRYHNWVKESSSKNENWLKFTAEQWLFIYYDIEKSIDKIKFYYIEFVETTVNLQEFTNNLIKESYNESCFIFESELLPFIANKIQQIIINECSEILVLLRGITATYRMTNRQIPIKPSPFAPKITQPLLKFIQNTSSINYLSSKKQQEWIYFILENLTIKFFEMTNELLSTLHSTDAVIAKFTKKSQISKNITLSDTDKIYVQLYLDVNEFQSQLVKFGIQTNNFQAFQNLFNFVSIGKKVM
jgi:hypothetical protein